MKKYLLLLGLIIIFSFFVSDKNEKNVVVNNRSYLEANLEIQEDNYFIADDYIQSIFLKTDKNKFLSGFKATSGTLNLDCNNHSNYVGTGCFLKTLLNENVTSSHGVVVYGDVTGDGVASITDMVQLVLHANEKKILSEKIKQVAADIDYDKNVTVDDAMSLAIHVQADIPLLHPSSKDIKTIIELSTTNISIEKNENVQIFATTNKGDVTIVDWKSTDPKIALVDSTGLVTGVGKGTTTIIVTAKDGTTRELVVNVNVTVPVTGVIMNKNELTLKEGEQEKLIATVSPSDATNKSVIWSSSNINIVAVDDVGTILAKAPGSAKITAKTKDGNYISECVVTVLSNTVSVTGVTLNASNGTVYINSLDKKVNLVATVSPNNATNKSLKWESSDTSVATVDNNGVVTLNKIGTAKITATTVDGGYQATYQLTGKKKAIVVITASLGVRMNDWFQSFVSLNNYKYKFDDSTLKYVYKSGSGFDYQVGEGLETAKTFINDKFSSKKEYIELFVFFTMTGNSVKNSTCNEITDSSEYEEIAKNYNSAIQSIKNEGYHVKGFVLSHPPLQSKHENASDHKIVYSTSSNACASGYRSSWKYYLSNEKIQSILVNYSNLTFIDNFSKYLILVDKEAKDFDWLRTYTTADGLHWDEATTIDYMTLAFNGAGM